jgi:hypothetical protein
MSTAATDREIYEYARRHYSPVLAIRLWVTLLQDSGFTRAVRRSWQHEIAQGRLA